MKKFTVILLLVFFTTGHAFADRCVKVSNQMVASIKDGFKNKKIKLVVSTVRAVKSKDYKSVYFIAGKTGNGEIGVWSSNSLKAGQGMITATDSYAVELSIWPDGRKSRAKLSMFDDGFSDALHCSQNALR